MLGNTNGINSRNYGTGDVVSLGNIVCAGYLTNSQGRLEFQIPLSKPIGASSVALNGNVYVRSIAGGYIASNVEINTLGTVVTAINTGGIYVQLTLASASSVTNNTPIMVQFAAGATATFS